jgi:hypothetical protein
MNLCPEESLAPSMFWHALATDFYFSAEFKNSELKQFRFLPTLERALVLRKELKSLLIRSAQKSSGPWRRAALSLSSSVMLQQAAPENGPRIMQVYRAALSINLEKGRVPSLRALQSKYAGRFA